ncbi:MAG TPA: hypothetical protein VNA24_11560 [Hyalangium sp.]|nr:hypothetical protein [Hyalangium sp.]
MDRAEAATLRGDYMEAAHAYKAACDADPDAELACAKVPLFNKKATDQAIASARPACDADDLDRCLPPLLAAKALIPDHPEVNAMLERASQVHTERCSAFNPEGPLATEAAGLACLQSRGAQLPVPSFQALLAERATLLAGKLAQLGITAGRDSLAGAGAVLLSATECLLEPGKSIGSLVQVARESFIAQSSLPIAAHIDGRLPPSFAGPLSHLCDSIAPNMAPAARCEDDKVLPNQPEPIEIRVSASIEPPVEQVTEDIRSLRYVSGTREVRNPEFRAARRRLSEAEDAVQRTESRKNAQEKECERVTEAYQATCSGCLLPPEKRKPCDDFELLADALDSRVRERNDARQHLSNTPEILIEKVMDDFVYRAQIHRWSLDYRFTLQASSSGAVPTPEKEGTVRFSDEEHVGFSPGGLDPDPLWVPSSSDYANAFIQRVSPSVLAEVKRESSARGATRRAECSALPAQWGQQWVQCWAEAALWESGKVPNGIEFLQLLAASAGGSSPPQCR